ncbi:MAG TPA: carbohydrate-binding protein [Selenomonadales bacterium]|nr:carbohydrate-binding protein [Selenomonadales bacterium]
MSKWFVYSAQGVGIEPALPSSQDTVTITYNGLLARSGATELYAHVGYNGWQDIRDYPMLKTARGFETSVIPPAGAGSVSVCFRDPAGNWDNNSGSDYSFDLQKQDFYDDYDPARDYDINLQGGQQDPRYLSSDAGDFPDAVSAAEEEALNWLDPDTHHSFRPDGAGYSQDEFDETAYIIW